MESKRTVHKGNACSFRHDENKRGKVTQSSISVSRAPTQNDGEVLSKGISEAVVLLERDLEDRAKTTFVEIVRIRDVILGILPNVNITKHIRDAILVKSAYSGTIRLTVSLTRSRRKVAVKVLQNQSSCNLNNPAEINGHSRVAPSRKYHLLQKVQYCTLPEANQFRETCATTSNQENAPAPERRNTPTGMISN